MINRKYKIKIQGSDWVYSCQSDDKYEKMFGTDSAGNVVKYKSEMCFKECEFCLSVIIHELTHIYSKSLCLSDTNEITIEDQEEIRATFLETHSIQILQKACHIYTRIMNTCDDKKIKKIIKNLDFLSELR